MEEFDPTSRASKMDWPVDLIRLAGSNWTEKMLVKIESNPFRSAQ